jgi:hypothetical protein
MAEQDETILYAILLFLLLGGAVIAAYLQKRNSPVERLARETKAAQNPTRHCGVLVVG